MNLPVRVIRYGLDQPLPERRQLRAGPLTASLEDGLLRSIAVGGQEVLRAIYAAVRDRNWGTIIPRFTSYEVNAGGESFSVRFTAEHRNAEIDFVWDGIIEGTADGVLTYTLDGTARNTFLRNRIGFCVLHPMELAGTPVEVETPHGIVAGTFPLRIAPHQPFFDIVALRQRFPSGRSMELRFAGDLFEMEDQRNWTDASYKTYCTPLRLPFPAEVTAGTRITQSVTLSVRGIDLTPPAPPARPAAVTVHLQGSAAGSSPARSNSGGRLPSLGLGVASHGQALSPAEIDQLRLLRLAHLRAVITLGDPTWSATLQQAASEATALGAALELEVIAAGDEGEGLPHLAAMLSALPEQAPPVARVLVFPPSGVVTTEPVLSRARQALTATGLRIPTGGGTRADFVNFNRATLPLHLMDVAGFAVNPQVHAFDNASLAETLAAQAVTVQNARQIAGDRPIALGPVTLKQRINPAATAPEKELLPGQLPPQVDPRQMSLFAAGWTAGSLRHLALAGVSSLTYFETTGWLGVMAQAPGVQSPQPAQPAIGGGFPSTPGMLFPLYHVLADVAELSSLSSATLLAVDVTTPIGIETLALRAGPNVRVLVANLTDTPQRVTLRLPGLARAQLRLLDETSAMQAMTDGPAFRERVDARLDVGSRPLDLDLLPYAIARLDGSLDPAST